MRDQTNTEDDAKRIPAARVREIYDTYIRDDVHHRW
jgi:hypothetical protein